MKKICLGKQFIDVLFNISQPNSFLGIGKCTGIVTRGIPRYVKNLKRRLKTVRNQNRNLVMLFVHED